MPVRVGSIIHRAARHCNQTAQEAHAALGYFVVPTFPLNFRDPKQVNIASILLERSQSLSTLVDIEDELHAATTTPRSIMIRIITKKTSTNPKVTKVENEKSHKVNTADFAKDDIIKTRKRPTSSRPAEIPTTENMPPNKKIRKIIFRLTRKPSPGPPVVPTTPKRSRQRQLLSPPAT